MGKALVHKVTWAYFRSPPLGSSQRWVRCMTTRANGITPVWDKVTCERCLATKKNNSTVYKPKGVKKYEAN